MSESQERSVYQAFFSQATKRPEADAVVFPDMVFSYAKIDRLVVAFATRLHALGVDANATVQLHTDDLLTQIAFLLAASRQGAQVVQESADLPLPASLGITHHFHTGFPTATFDPASALIDAEWSPSRVTDPTPPEADTDPSRAWLFVHTSGTTGEPKFIGLSQSMVIARSKAVEDDFLAGTTRFASTMPVHSRAFLARGLAALINGATLVGSNDPDEWQALGATVVSGSVIQMTRLARRGLNVRLPLAEVFGARLRKDDAMLLLMHFDEVHDVIGATEANKIYANVLRRNEAGDLVIKGAPRDTEIEIVDGFGAPVAPGEEGVLRVRNSYLASAYVDDAVASDAAFKDRWFLTGDAARFTGDKVLEIRDRTGHVLNVKGAKISGFLIDQVLRSAPGVRDAVAFKNPKPDAKDEVFAFIVLEDGANMAQAITVAQLECEERLGVACRPEVINIVAGIPRDSEGLVDRAACAAFILELAARPLPADAG